METSFAWEPTAEARDLLFGSDSYWQHLRSAISEGYCPRCSSRLEPVELPEARTAGYCLACDVTFFTGGIDTEWAESGEKAGRG